MKKVLFFLVFLVFILSYSPTFAQRQDSTIRDTIYFNPDSVDFSRQFPLAYWLNDSELFNPSDSITYVDTSWLVIQDSLQHTDSTIFDTIGKVETNGRSFT